MEGSDEAGCRWRQRGDQQQKASSGSAEIARRVGSKFQGKINRVQWMSPMWVFWSSSSRMRLEGTEQDREGDKRAVQSLGRSHRQAEGHEDCRGRTGGADS